MMPEIGIATSIITLIEKSLAAYRSIAAAKNFGSNAGQQVMMLRFEAFRYREWAQDNDNITKIFENAKTDLARGRGSFIGLVQESKAISPAATVHNALCDAVTQIIDILVSANTILAKYETSFASLEQPSAEPPVTGLSGLVVTVDGKAGGMAQSQRRFGELKNALQSKASFPRRVKYGIQTWDDADKEILKGLIEMFKYWNDGLYGLAPPSKADLVELGLSSRLVASASTQEELQSVQIAASDSQYEAICRSARMKQRKNEGQGKADELKFEDVQLDTRFLKSRRLITNYYPNGTSFASLILLASQSRLMLTYTQKGYLCLQCPRVHHPLNHKES
jgi:hypothetical protein